MSLGEHSLGLSAMQATAPGPSSESEVRGGRGHVNMRKRGASAGRRGPGPRAAFPAEDARVTSALVAHSKSGLWRFFMKGLTLGGYVSILTT